MKPSYTNSILYLDLNFKYQMSSGTKDASRAPNYSEINHHRALGKQKFSLENAAGF